jgi:hypothetical protein
MYRNWVERMACAGTPGERREVAGDLCRVFGFSERKAYRVLREGGWESGRTKRRDAGETALDETVLLALAAMEKLCVRKNGKATLPVNVARSILQARGVDIPVGDRRIRELLRERHLSVEDMKAATPHQAMRTEYPNQVHFADPSVCLIYFAPGGGMKTIGDDELYKNKNFLEGRLKCWRYVLTDHYSSSVCVRYYAAMGETAANMYDFLLYAWGMKQIPEYVFHGLPELLIWDCGTANIARATTAALKAFGVKTMPHLPGNPRTKGQVECANNLVECHFESRLRFEPAGSIEELNDAAERWCAAFNGDLLDGLDARLKRAGQYIGARSMLWNRIRKEELRELPDAETCRQVFANGVQTRKVAGDLTISIVHPKAGHSLKYSVRDLDGIMPGMTVELQPLLVTEAPLCIVSYESGGVARSFEIAPIVFDGAGFDLSAPVFGEGYKRPKDTARDKARKGLERPEMREAVMGPAHSFIRPQTPFLSQTEGSPVSVAETVKVSEILISATEAAKRCAAETGGVPEGFIPRLRKEYPEGVPTTFVNALLEKWKARNRPERDLGAAAVISGGGKAADADTGFDLDLGLDLEKKLA